MKIDRKLLLLFLVAFLPAGLFAQKDILTAGCNSTSSSGSVTWSVGLVAYNTWSEATGFLTEGVQQPYEIFNIAGIENAGPEPDLIVYPNPTDGKVTLKFFDPNLKDRSCHISDTKGNLIRTLNIEKNEVSVPMDDLKPATYLLIILIKDQPVKTCKIIKK